MNEKSGRRAAYRYNQLKITLSHVMKESTPAEKTEYKRILSLITLWCLDAFKDGHEEGYNKATAELIAGVEGFEGGNEKGLDHGRDKGYDAKGYEVGYTNRLKNSEPNE